jgi:hypothetical protein
VAIRLALGLISVLSAFTGCGAPESQTVHENFGTGVAGHGAEVEQLPLLDPTLNLSQVPGGWSPWLSPNPNGVVTNASLTFSGKTIGIDGYEQAGYGLVNLRLYAQDSHGAFYTSWTTANFGGWFKSAGLGANDQAIGIYLKEQYGRGLIDAMMITRRNSSGWLTGNPNANEYHWSQCAQNYELGGIQVKEQAGYGIVNLRIYCKPI